MTWQMTNACDAHLRRAAILATISVFGFRVRLNPSEKIELETTLSELINHDEDQVLFVSLGPAEGRGDRVITALGLPYTKLDAPCYVV